MKIENNESTRLFIGDVRRSVSESSAFRESVFRFMNKPISVKNEQEILDRYNKYGIPTQTIEYDSDEMTQNPFYKNIKLEDIKNKKVQYKNKALGARNCLNMSYIKYADKLFKNYLDIGYFKKDVNIPILFENNTLWMSPTIAETRSMQEDINKAHGNVLTFGLGIAYYTYMCLLKDDVESMTIVEMNADVIELFNEYILPQFKTTKKIEIIQGNMYDYYNEDFISKFDYTFVDVWKDNSDGLVHYKKLMQTGLRKESIGFWIEDSIIEPIRMIMAIYFNSIIDKVYTDVLMSMEGDTQQELKMVHKYFRGIDKTITSYDELLYFINDKDTIRNILGIKI